MVTASDRRGALGVMQSYSRSLAWEGGLEDVGNEGPGVVLLDDEDERRRRRSN